MAGMGVRVLSRGMFALASPAGSECHQTFGVAGSRSAVRGIGPFVDGDLCARYVDLPYAAQRAVSALVGTPPDVIHAEIKWIDETNDGLF